MDRILLPLRITQGKLDTINDEKKSIDEFLFLLISTPKNSFVVDKNFGFIFNNLKFEILNENEGVVYDSANEQLLQRKGIYEKKISGSSKNLNTFAAELKEAIDRYEKRLQGVSVTMSYIREEKLIYIAVKGTIVSSKERYRYITTIKIWS